MYPWGAYITIPHPYSFVRNQDTNPESDNHSSSGGFTKRTEVKGGNSHYLFITRRNP